VVTVQVRGYPPQDAEPIYCAIKLLVKALAFARDVGGEGWGCGDPVHQQFAIELDRLLKVGLSECDLRWLIRRGYVEHHLELTSSGEAERTFAKGGARFHHNSCFVISAAGAEAYLSWPGAPESPINMPTLWQGSDRRDGTKAGVAHERPHWDGVERRLMYGDKLVKEFRVPAPNQETILAAFEEEGWPRRIDDPLPPEPGIDPKRRLHDTLSSLNRCQRHNILQFLGDGAGIGVRWCVR
jgi:hypothetical protein